MKKLKIVEKKVNELIPYKDNPRINHAAIEPVAASIREFGFINPIIINKDNVIIAGHTRYEAAKMELDKVQCIVIDDMNEEEETFFRIADNRTAEFSTWNLPTLNDEVNNGVPEAFDYMDIDSILDEANKDFPKINDELINFDGKNKAINANYLKFANFNILLSEEELKKLNAVYDNYVKENRNNKHFVKFILDNQWK